MKFTIIPLDSMIQFFTIQFYTKKNSSWELFQQRTCNFSAKDSIVIAGDYEKASEAKKALTDDGFTEKDKKLSRLRDCQLL